MGERQVLVDPGAARQAREFSSRADSMICRYLPVDHVAVVVDGGEVVVRADLLDLPERVEQRPVVPQRHVVDRGRVAIEVGARQARVARQRSLLDLVEPERRRASPGCCCTMNGVSRTCSFGATTKRWMTAA